jgi:hypothetical protein
MKMRRTRFRTLEIRARAACGIALTDLGWPLWTDPPGHQRDYIIPAHEFRSGWRAHVIGTGRNLVANGLSCHASAMFSKA